MSSFNSLDRAVEILFAFTKEEQCLTAEQIAKKIGLPRGSIYRYINALMEKGLIEKHESRSMFRLGCRLLYFQSVIRYHDTLERISYPYMEKLAAKTSETIQLTIMKENYTVAIRSVESTAMVRVAPPVGLPGPMHAGANSKAIIAFRDRKEWDQVCARGLAKLAPSTITEPDEFLRELARVREQGYAYSVEELHQGAWGAAAPVFDANGNVTASLGVSGPLFRNSSELKDLSIRLVMEYSRKISEEMGCPHIRAK